MDTHTCIQTHKSSHNTHTLSLSLTHTPTYTLQIQILHTQPHVLIGVGTTFFKEPSKSGTVQSQKVLLHQVMYQNRHTISSHENKTRADSQLVNIFFTASKVHKPLNNSTQIRIVTTTSTHHSLSSTVGHNSSIFLQPHKIGTFIILTIKDYHRAN